MTLRIHRRGSVMISVDLLLTEPGRLTVPVGRIDFYALPVQKKVDFVAIPPAIVSFAEVQTVSVELFRSAVRGRIGRYEWRKSS
jgi:hypothetical protein